MTDYILLGGILYSKGLCKRASLDISKLSIKDRDILLNELIEDEKLRAKSKRGRRKRNIPRPTTWWSDLSKSMTTGAILGALRGGFQGGLMGDANYKPGVNAALTGAGIGALLGGVGGIPYHILMNLDTKYEQ